MDKINEWQMSMFCKRSTFILFYFFFWRLTILVRIVVSSIKKEKFIGNAVIGRKSISTRSRGEHVRLERNMRFYIHSTFCFLSHTLSPFIRHFLFHFSLVFLSFRLEVGETTLCACLWTRRRIMQSDWLELIVHQSD